MIIMTYFIWVGSEVVSCASNVGCVPTPLSGFLFLLGAGSLELVVDFVAGGKIFQMWQSDSITRSDQ